MLTDDEHVACTANEDDLQDSPQPHSSTTLGLLHQLRIIEKSQKDSLVKDETRTQPIISPIHHTSNDTK